MRDSCQFTSGPCHFSDAPLFRPLGPPPAAPPPEESAHDREVRTMQRRRNYPSYCRPGIEFRMDVLRVLCTVCRKEYKLGCPVCFAFDPQCLHTGMGWASSSRTTIRTDALLKDKGGSSSYNLLNDTSLSFTFTSDKS